LPKRKKIYVIFVHVYGILSCMKETTQMDGRCRLKRFAFGASG